MITSKEVVTFFMHFISVIKSSLKTKIVTRICIVIISLMLFLSVVLLLKWREIIIQKEAKSQVPPIEFE